MYIRLKTNKKFHTAEHLRENVYKTNFITLQSAQNYAKL